MSFDESSVFGNRSGDIVNSQTRICYTQKMDYRQDYSNNEKNKLFIFVTPDWKELEPKHDGSEKDNGLPKPYCLKDGYDRYGLSMIFIWVSPNGELAYSNTRWNHKASYVSPNVDGAFTTDVFEGLMGASIEELTGIKNIYDKLDILEDRVNNGEDPNNFFNVTNTDIEGLDLLEFRENFNLYDKRKGRIILDDWYEKITPFDEHGDLLMKKLIIERVFFKDTFEELTKPEFIERVGNYIVDKGADPKAFNTIYKEVNNDVFTLSFNGGGYYFFSASKRRLLGPFSSTYGKYDDYGNLIIGKSLIINLESFEAESINDYIKLMLKRQGKDILSLESPKTVFNATPNLHLLTHNGYYNVYNDLDNKILLETWCDFPEKISENIFVFLRGITVDVLIIKNDGVKVTNLLNLTDSKPVIYPVGEGPIGLGSLSSNSYNFPLNILFTENDIVGENMNFKNIVPPQRDDNYVCVENFSEKINFVDRNGNFYTKEFVFDVRDGHESHKYYLSGKKYARYVVSLDGKCNVFNAKTGKMMLKSNPDKWYDEIRIRAFAVEDEKKDKDYYNNVDYDDYYENRRIIYKEYMIVQKNRKNNIIYRNRYLWQHPVNEWFDTIFEAEDYPINGFTVGMNLGNRNVYNFLKLDGTLAFNKPAQKWFESFYGVIIKGRKIYYGKNYSGNDKFYFFNENSQRMFNGLGFDDVEVDDDKNFLVGTIGEDTYILTATGNILKRSGYYDVDRNDFNTYIEKMLSKGYDITDLVDEVYREKGDSYGNILIRFNNDWNILSPNNEVYLDKWAEQCPRLLGDFYRIKLDGRRENAMRIDGEFLFDSENTESWPYSVTPEIFNLLRCYLPNGRYNIGKFGYGLLLEEDARSIYSNKDIGFIIAFYDNNNLIFDSSLNSISKEDLFNMCNKYLESNDLQELFKYTLGQRRESGRYIGIGFCDGFSNLYDKNEKRFIFKEWVNRIYSASENIIVCEINNNLVFVQNNGEINFRKKNGQNYVLDSVSGFVKGIGIVKGRFTDRNSSFETYIKADGNLLVNTGFSCCAAFANGFGLAQKDGYVFVLADGRILGDGMEIRRINNRMDSYNWRGKGIADVTLQDGRRGYLTINNEFIPIENNNNDG